MAFRDNYKNTVADDEKKRVIEEALQTDEGQRALIESITNRNFPTLYDPTPVKFISDKLIIKK